MRGTTNEKIIKAIIKAMGMDGGNLVRQRDVPDVDLLFDTFYS